MNTLFPDIHPYKQHHLTVDDLHTLYIEESGNAQGIPVLFIHGGPGGGTSSFNRSFFDPEKYRIILFDQRGCGQSTPYAELLGNTTAHLISDIEKIREYLSIDEWLLFGGSWGSTLSLLYAESFPERVSGMILRGIFLCRERDIHWFYQAGASAIFPDYWKEYQKVIPQQEQGAMLEAYYKRLTNDNDLQTQTTAAVHWSLYEGACSSLMPNYETITTNEQKQRALALARIEAHYFKFEVFSKEKSLLNHIESLRSIPTTIIQGRYDIICPIKTANKLHQLWPEADYIVVPDAGHSALDTTLRSRLIEATESAKTINE